MALDHRRKTFFCINISTVRLEKQNRLEPFFGMVTRITKQKIEGKKFVELTDYSRKNINEWRKNKKMYKMGNSKRFQSQIGGFRANWVTKVSSTDGHRRYGRTAALKSTINHEVPQPKHSLTPSFMQVASVLGKNGKMDNCWYTAFAVPRHWNDVARTWITIMAWKKSCLEKHDLTGTDAPKKHLAECRM